MRVLFVIVDGGGNVPPALGIAAELSRRGAEVSVLGHPGVREPVERAGLAFEPFATVPPFDPRAKRSSLRGLLDLVAMSADRRVGADAVTVARRDGADVVVVDCLATAGIRGVVAAGPPAVSLVHCPDAYFSTLPRGPVGLVHRLHGLDMRRVQASPALRIVTSRPELDPVAAEGQRTKHVGVVWQGNPVAAVPVPVPRVLVSLSTTSFPGQERTLQSILDALAGLPVEAIVTTGPAMDPVAFRAPANATVHRWLDHGEVLPSASAVIGHGGHSTTMRALSYGVPVLVIPSHPMLDQALVGRIVTGAGVGATLPKGADPARIAEVATQLLGDRRIRSAAAALGADIRLRDGAAVAADLIEEVATAQPQLAQATTSPTVS